MYDKVIGMKTFNLNGDLISLKLGKYQNGGVAVTAHCQNGPYATVSVYLPGANRLPEGAFYLKDWSENELIANYLRANGLIEPVDAEPVKSGFVRVRAYRLTEVGKEYL
jgi:hypothetical protein